MVSIGLPSSRGSLIINQNVGLHSYITDSSTTSTEQSGNLQEQYVRMNLSSGPL